MLLDMLRGQLKVTQRFLHSHLDLKPGTAAASKPEWVGVVGLEIHAQINSLSKLVSGSGTAYAAPTNTQVSLFDCATPGTLPVLNRRCVEAAVKTSLALNCTVHRVSRFDRKHYFYADLPAGYQITQHFHPIANDGWLDYVVVNPASDKPPEKLRASIEQVQLEQDSGKSLHNSAAGTSLIDLNRAGTGLMEIITRPDFKNGLQASCFLRELAVILRNLNVCDVRMFEGSLRVDANVSVHRPGEPLGVRSEVKNLNSMKFVQKAVDFEIARQVEVLRTGGVVINETRGFDLRTETTHSMRDKESLQDYRYMPEPNLPPLRLIDSDLGDTADSSKVDIAPIRRGIPEAPSVRRFRFLNDLKITPRMTDTLLADDSIAELFDKSVSLLQVCTPFDLAGIIAVHHSVLKGPTEATGPKHFVVNPKSFAILADMMSGEKIGQPILSRILSMMCTPEGGEINPVEVVAKNQWYQINDKVELEKLCDAAMANNPELVAAGKTFRTTTVNKLTESVLRATNELANVRIVTGIMDEKLTSLYGVKKKKK